MPIDLAALQRKVQTVLRSKLPGGVCTLVDPGTATVDPVTDAESAPTGEVRYTVNAAFPPAGGVRWEAGQLVQNTNNRAIIEAVSLAGAEPQPGWQLITPTTTYKVLRVMPKRPDEVTTVAYELELE